MKNFLYNPCLQRFGLNQSGSGGVSGTDGDLVSVNILKNSLTTIMIGGILPDQQTASRPMYGPEQASPREGARGAETKILTLSANHDSD